MPVVLAYVAAGTGSISAIAGAVSARTNLSAVRRANLPLVYGEPAFGRKFGPWRTQEEADNAPITGVFVRLRNDGPGTAVEVRCCLRSTSGDWMSQPIDPVRAMHPGEIVPIESRPGFGFQVPWEVDPGVTSWGVATRFQDTSGREWETFNQRFPAGQMSGRKLRSSAWQLTRARVDW